MIQVIQDILCLNFDIEAEGFFFLRGLTMLNTKEERIAGLKTLLDFIERIGAFIITLRVDG